METVSFDELAPDDPGDGTVRSGLSELLGTTHVAVNRYRVPPGDGFPGGIHAHADQEEVFVVLEGVVTFETLAGVLDVGEGEAVRFAPGEFQSGRNDSDDVVVALALGAPRDTEDLRIPFPCRACGHDDLRLATADGELTFVCPGCGAERVPRPCPACGGDDLRVQLGEGPRPVVACRDCGAAFDRPPVRDGG